MIDKEVINEYVTDMTKYYASTHNGEIPSQFEKYLRKAVEKGMELSKIKWHNLREDPNDLPNCAHGHTVFDQDLDRVIIRNGRFEFLDGCIAHVIAWCEIPKFKEE